jgi:hypothetical protein
MLVKIIDDSILPQELGAKGSLEERQLYAREPWR